MSEPNTQQNKHQPNDEIDIFEFCSRIWGAFEKFLINIKDIIVSIIVFLIRKSVWIASFAIVGALIGYLWHGISKPLYSSSLEGYTGGLDNRMIIDHINKLEQLVVKPGLLANYLNINEDEAKSIKSVKAYYGIDVNKDGRMDYIDFKGTYNPADTNQIRISSFLYLKVSVHDENILPVLRKGLLNYINSNPYFRERFNIDRGQKKETIEDIDIEISKIDSLQRSRFRKDMFPNSSQIVFLGNQAETKLFDDEIMKLRAQKQALQGDLKVSEEIIVVVQDFTSLSEEENPLLRYILICSIAMAVLGFFCALLWQYRKKIWELIKEDSTKR